MPPNALQARVMMPASCSDQGGETLHQSCAPPIKLPVTRAPKDVSGLPPLESSRFRKMFSQCATEVNRVVLGELWWQNGSIEENGYDRPIEGNGLVTLPLDLLRPRGVRAPKDEERLTRVNGVRDGHPPLGTWLDALHVPKDTASSRPEELS